MTEYPAFIMHPKIKKLSQLVEMVKRNCGIRMVILCLTILGSGLFTAGVAASDGGISVSLTRMILVGGQKSEKVTLINRSDRVYLINSRVLQSPYGAGEPNNPAPFMVTPPLFRLESDSRNSVMVVRNDTSTLPTDRESVFYLSFLAVPSVSKPEDNDGADGVIQPRVSVGIRSVIKLFYRPSSLGMSVHSASEKLLFAQRGNVLHAENPTPYYLTLAQLQVNGQAVDIREQGAMIAPFSSRDYQVTGAIHDVDWSVINDYGGVSRTYQTVLQEK